MKLSQLLNNIDILSTSNFVDIDIKHISSNSKDIKKNSIFFAIKGTKFDGQDFIPEAIKNGASVVVLEKDINIPKNITKIIVSDTRETFAKICSNFYKNPCNKLKIVGVTGTNGKTTTTYLCNSIFKDNNFKTSLFGTIKNIIDEKILKTNLTTSDPAQLQKYLYQSVQKKVNYVFMEVSSHGLAQKRIKGCKFDVAVFTNLSQDHLDYHKNMEDYFQTKLKLFSEYGKYNFISVLNSDDEYGKRIIELLKKKNNNFITYGIESEADIKAENINLYPDKTKFKIIYKNKKINIQLKLISKFNIYNSLAACGVGISQGIDIEKIKYSLENIPPILGRMEKVSNKTNFYVFVDYAHTPDGLKEILLSAKEFCRGRILLVFGCGGDRDKTKRPIMGEIASNFSDYVIITSDNPRTEDPEKIIQDIEAGFLKNKKDNYEIIVDRYSAIKKILTLAKKNDVVLIVGKGHENYQIFKDRTIHFDDKEVVKEILNPNFSLRKIWVPKI